MLTDDIVRLEGMMDEADLYDVDMLTHIDVHCGDGCPSLDGAACYCTEYVKGLLDDVRQLRAVVRHYISGWCAECEETTSNCGCEWFNSVRKEIKWAEDTRPQSARVEPK